MMYYEFTAGDQSYKLRLNARAIVELEKAIGKNPIYIFTNKANNNTPTMEEMVMVLYHALKPLQEETKIDDAYNIFDQWLEDGHICGEFTAVIVEVFKISGLFKKQEEKN